MCDAETVLIVLFSVGHLRMGLDASAVKKVCPAVAVTPLENLPASVLGIIDVQGTLAPVFDLRVRMGLPPRPLRRSDQMILAHRKSQLVALLVDDVAEVAEAAGSQFRPVDEFAGGDNTVREVFSDRGELLLICDLDRFLSAEEEAAVRAAIEDI